jgi:hypothetical protein
MNKENEDNLQGLFFLSKKPIYRKSDRDSFLCCIRSQTINGIIDFVELSLIVALPIDRLLRQEKQPL